MSSPHPPAQGIQWPAQFAPEKSTVHVKNEIDIAASPEVVWAWLVRAADWPAWYVNSHDVCLEKGKTELAAGVRFRWTTFGLRVSSCVEEFVPCSRLAWNAFALGGRAYHAWLILPTPAGCHVITEESQNGFVAWLAKILQPNRMSRYHQIWLESLRDKAQSGPPK